MPKYLGKLIFSLGRFAEVTLGRSGSKAKDGEKKREEERLNDGDNNGQAMHGARMAHASRLGQQTNHNLERLRSRLVCLNIFDPSPRSNVENIVIRK